MKALLVVTGIVALFAVALGIGAGLGCFASWVLSGFGIQVAWYYCWGAIVLLGMFIRNARPEVAK